MKLYTYLLLVFTLLFTITTDLYSASVSGYIKDSTNQEILIGATIRIDNSTKGALTNKDGYYVISNLDKGTITITISYIGYESKTLNFDLDTDEDKRLDVKLNQGSVGTTELTVYDDRDDDKVEISISKVNIPIQQIKKIRIGGESDIFRTLQLLPGVLTSSQISSGP